MDKDNSKDTTKKWEKMRKNLRLKGGKKGKKMKNVKNDKKRDYTKMDKDNSKNTTIT